MSEAYLGECAAARSVLNAATQPSVAQPIGYRWQPRRPSQSWRCSRVLLAATSRIGSAPPRKMRRR